MKKLNKLRGLACLLAMLSIAGCKKDAKTPQAAAQTKQASTSNVKMVLFPGAGWVPADQVHLIEPGNYLKKQNGHILKLEIGTDRVVQDFGEFKQIGINQPASAGTQTQPTTGFNSRDRRLASGGNPNWITYAAFTSPPALGAVNFFSAKWLVPHVPVSDHQTLFVFNGLMDATQADILQPVLQYGASAYMGGYSGWSITNTYYMPPPAIGALGFYAYTTPVAVAYPTLVTGVMSLVNINLDGSYNYKCSFTGYSNTLILSEGVTPLGAGGDPKKNYSVAPAIPALIVASATIEAYSLSGPPPAVLTDYPSDNVDPMTNISITNLNGTPTLSWAATTNFSMFGAHTNVITNLNPGGEVDLYFHNPVAPPVFSYTTPDVLADGITANLAPTNTGGTPLSYSISPGLPPGLTFNTSTGVISGPPSTVTAATNYNVTATNWGGTYTTTVNITTVADVNFGITNNSGNGLSITFYRMDQPQSNISMVANAHSGTNPPLPVPPGLYSIRWNPSGSPVNCVVTLSNGQSSPNEPGGQFNSISVNNAGGVTSLSAR